jgi:hypothetical protein
MFFGERAMLWPRDNIPQLKQSVRLVEHCR